MRTDEMRRYETRQKKNNEIRKKEMTRTDGLRLYETIWDQTKWNRRLDILDKKKLNNMREEKIK